MEETTALSDVLNFLSLGLSVVLLMATAYLWSSNNRKSDELQQLQKDVQKLKKKLSTLEERVSEIREPQVIADVPEVEPFGLNLDEHKEMRITPLAPQKMWLNFVQDYNNFVAELESPGELRKCEKFVRDNKLKSLTYGNSTIRPAIDVKDSIYWAFKCSGDEFAVVPNPLNPCDDMLVELGGLKELYALNYKDGTYKKYFVKTPAIVTSDSVNGWRLKETGVVNLER